MGPLWQKQGISADAGVVYMDVMRGDKYKKGHEEISWPFLLDVLTTHPQGI